MIKYTDSFLEKFSYFAIVLCVGLMLILTISNIVMRWFNLSALWIDPFVRHLVFLSAFLGGVLATGADKHIRIDLIGRAFEKYERKTILLWINRINYLMAMLATFLMAKAGLDFAKVELQYGKVAFLGIHSGFLTAIIPIGFSLIFFRFLLKIFLTFTKEKNE